MKRDEITKCVSCHLGIAANGLTFYKISMERFILDPRAIERQHGLEMMLGSPVLAGVMGPNEDLAKPVSKKIDFLMCEQCACEEKYIAIIHQIEQDKEV